MDNKEFESLSHKVEQAVSLIGVLKQERDELKTELHTALEKAGTLEKELAEKELELNSIQLELGKKAENMSMAGERIRSLVSRLEVALT